MKFINVKFKNFKSYPDNEVEIDLTFKGAKLVVGKNGAGKSTALEVIGWVIYGKTQDSSDGIVNRITKKDCKGELNFYIGKDLYSIVRYRKHTEFGNKLFLFKNKKDISSPKAPETQNIINDVVAMPYLGFISSIYYSMEQAGGFLRTKNSERLKKIEAVLPIGSINAIRDKIKKDIDILGEKEKLLKDEKNSLNITIAEKENSIISYKENCAKQIREFSSAIEKIEADEKYLAESNQENSKIDIDIEIKKIKNNDLRKSIESLKNFHSSEEVFSLERKIIDNENKISYIPPSRTNFKIVDLGKKIVDISIEEKEIESLKSELDQIELIDIKLNLKLLDDRKKLEQTKKDLEYKLKEIERILQIVDEKKKRIQEIEEEVLQKEEKFQDATSHRKTCPTCSQSISDEIFLVIKDSHEKQINELRTLVSSIESQLQTEEVLDVVNNLNRKEEIISKVSNIEIAISKIEVKYSEEFLNKSEERKEIIKKSIDEKESKIKDVCLNNKKLESQIEAYKGEISESFDRSNLINLISIEDFIALEDGLKKSILEAKSKIKDLEKDKEETTKKINILESNYDPNLPVSMYSEDFLNSIRDIKENFDKNLKRLEDEKSVLKIRMESVFDTEYAKEIENSIAPIKVKLEEVEKKFSATYNVLKHCTFLYDYILSNKTEGFKKYFISKIVDTFNEKINFFLEFFFEEKVEIVFDKELNEVIKVDGEEVSFSSFSSGQKTRAETAISFAMFNLVKVYFSNEINLAVFDEVLDANLDKEGVEAAINVLKYFTDDNAVFVMSHREEVQEKFLNKIVITRENGLTRIKEF